MTEADAEAESRHRAEMERLRGILEEQEQEESQYREMVEQWDRVQVNVKRRLEDPYFYNTPKVQECLSLDRSWRTTLEHTDIFLFDAQEREDRRARADRMRVAAFRCWVEALLTQESP